MSDFAAFLSNVKGRRMPWMGHADFPKKVVTAFESGAYPWLSGLRIFELDWQNGQPEYFLLSDERIQEYVDGSA